MARRAHVFLAAFVAAALLLRLGLTIFDPDPAPGDPNLLTRMIRFVSYFTIESNFAVLLASLAVVTDKALGEPWMRALRLASLIGITVTGIVYVTILAGDSDLTGWSSVANYMLHYIAPPLTIVVWLAVGPWPGFAWADLARALIWPLLWIVYTLIHGAIAEWYPYPFIDVIVKGYGKVTVSIIFITIFAVVLGSAFVVIDRWRARRAVT